MGRGVQGSFFVAVRGARWGGMIVWLACCEFGYVPVLNLFY